MTNASSVWVLSDVEVDGSRRDVTISGGRVADISPVGIRQPAADVTVLDGGGGTLLPGLHDHHMHLFATAAARDSVDVGPRACPSPAVFADRLRIAAHDAAGRWVRGTGYHEDVAGPLDRHVLDALMPDAPARVQDSSGALWILNTVALRELARRVTGRSDLDDLPHRGVERSDGLPTGRLWRRDDLIQSLGEGPPDLKGVGRDLARLGITGVTDATPTADLLTLDRIRSAQDSATLPTHVQLLASVTATSDHWCDPDCSDVHAHLTLGALKIVLADHSLPSFAELTSRIDQAHSAGRPVAVHCVTRASISLLVAALDSVGTIDGDRIEHASVVPVALLSTISRLRLRVVTQPSFIRLRGDRYLRDCAPDDLPHLYRYSSLMDAGVLSAASSDAPYGDLDPWANIRDARDRLTDHGVRAGEDQGVPPMITLSGYLNGLDQPGGRPRRVEVGAPADLVQLYGSLADTLANPVADRVRRTWLAGQLAYDVDESGR